jgi:hypothetical protein
MVFIAEAFGGWLLGQVADAGRRRLGGWFLGDELERALHQAATAAIQRTARELRPGPETGDELGAEYLAKVLDEAFYADQVFHASRWAGPPPAQVTLLQALQDGVAWRLSVLADESITGMGQSAAELLGVSVPMLADMLTTHLLQEIVARGVRGGPLTALANQLNHEFTQLQVQQMRASVEQLVRQQQAVPAALDRVDQAAQASSMPQGAAVPTSRLDTAALADAVMRGPVEAIGMEHALAEADRRRDDRPEAAAAGYAEVERALEQNEFTGHALLIRRRRAAALRAAGQLDQASELLADLTWVYLNRGDIGEARVILHELSGIVAAEGSEEALAPHTRLLEKALDAVVTLLQDPIDRMEPLGAVVDRLVAEYHPYAGRVAVLFAETALAAEQPTEISRRSTALHRLADDLAEELTDDRLLSMRLRLCLADVESQWESLLDTVRGRRLPNDQAALVLARYARDRAWKADPQAAEDSWREAVERGCLARLNGDAADWLYAQRDLHVRYGPIDETLEEPHHLAQALRAAGGAQRLIEQRRDPRELGLDRMQHGQWPEAADALRRYLRFSVIAGRWTNELDAHQLLAALFAQTGEPGLAVQHLIRAGAAKRAREIAEGVGERYLDVTDQLDRPAPWERAVAYQVIAEQGDLVPDDGASTIVERALADIDAIATGRARDMAFFGPSVYRSAHLAIAALADRADEDQARQILDQLAPLVTRGPNEYRHTDDPHVDALVGVAIAHSALRHTALNQLLDLLAQGSSVAERVLRRARQLFAGNEAVVIPRLRELAATGGEYAAQMLGLLGYYDDDQLERGRRVLDRWAAPRQRQPGTISFGTSAVQDSILVRALPAADRAAFAARMLELTEDPEEPGFNRQEFVIGAINVVSDLREADRIALYERAIRLARGELTPSRVDQDLPFSNHPLSRFRYSIAPGALPPTGLELAARLASTPEEAAAVQAVALELLRHGDANSIQQVAVALSWLPREQLSLDRNLLATHPHHGLRTLAAIRWVQDPTSDPELGLALAQDPDPRVRRWLAKAIHEEGVVSPEVEPVRQVLKLDPRWSVRRSLQAG